MGKTLEELEADLAEAYRADFDGSEDRAELDRALAKFDEARTRSKVRKIERLQKAVVCIRMLGILLLLILPLMLLILEQS